MRLSTGRPAGARTITARATHHSITKKLFCVECGALREASRVGGSKEFLLAPCGHTRVLFTSEAVDDRNSAVEKGKTR